MFHFWSSALTTVFFTCKVHSNALIKKQLKKTTAPHNLRCLINGVFLIVLTDV